MGRSRKRSLYIGAVAAAAYQTADTSDGSTLTPVPCFSIGDPPAGIEQLETNYQNGRPYPTTPEVGPDGGDISFETAAIGMATAAGDGTNASSVTDDWFDILLTRTFGVQATTAGEGVASSTASTLTLDTDSQSLGDIVPVFEAGLPTGVPHTQWAGVTLDNADGSYSVAPNWAANPTNAAIAYGTKYYTLDEDNQIYLTAVLVDDDLTSSGGVGVYTMTGCRITGFRISARAGQMARISWTLRYDACVEDTANKTALPASVSAPVITPCKAMASAFAFNGTFYDTANLEFDLGLDTAPIEATSGNNGRSGDEIVSGGGPSMRVTPLATNAIRNLKRSITEGPAIMQLGAGILAGGVLNGFCLAFGNAYVSEASRQDDRGITRHGVTIMASDPGATGRFVQAIRA